MRQFPVDVWYGRSFSVKDAVFCLQQERDTKKGNGNHEK